MINLKNKYSLLSILLFSIVCNLYAIKTIEETNEKKIYVFELHQEIGPAATRTTKKAIENAEKMNADFIIIDLNTYGGLVSDADEIRTALLNTDITTMVFIRNNAASAGALISIACDSIYMKEGSTIGAAAVVNENGEIMPEKYQSYMRTKMRATAEATNRNPDIAEGMVDPRIEIKDVTTKDKIITFTVDDAIKHNYCNAKAENIEDLIKIAKIENYSTSKYIISFVETIISFFVNPAISGVLLMIIIGGIYYELQSPGIGFPIAASIIAAVLYFLPHYLEGLAANWEILLFFIGVVLLAIEVFVIPGFGIAGITGILVVVMSLVLSLVRNIDGFDFSFVPEKQLFISFLTVSMVMMAGLMSLFFGGGKLMSLAFAKSNIGNKAELNEKSKFVFTIKSLIGEEGKAMTDLRPAGKVEIDNKRFNAISDGEYILKGDFIKVVAVSGTNLIVDKVLV